MLKLAALRSAKLVLGTGRFTHWLSLLPAAEPWREEGSSKSPGVETKNSRLRAALAVLADVPMEDWEALAQERQAGTSATSSSDAPEARAGTSATSYSEAPEAEAGANAEAGSGTQQEGTGSGDSHLPETVQQQGHAASAAASEAGDGEDAGSMVASERSCCTAPPHPRCEEGPASPQLPMPEAAGGAVGTGAHIQDAAGSSAGRQAPANGAPSSVFGGT